MTTQDEWTDWERRVDAARPPQYKTEDLSWAEPLVQEAAALIDPDEARYEMALRRFKSHERIATQRANKVLREIAETGALPLAWMDLARLPIVIDEERFQLATCTARDFEQWELNERRRSAEQFRSSNAACDGAKQIHQWMLAQGVMRFAELDESQIPRQGELSDES